jgi:membrane-associated phospholipid phosphatase
MTRGLMYRMLWRCAAVTTVTIFGSAVPANAQVTGFGTSVCESSQSTGRLFTGTLTDLRRLPSRSSLGIMSVGAAAALGTHAVDTSATRAFSGETELRSTFKSGAVLGGAPLQMGAAFASYAIGRALHKPCVARVGAELFQAQLIAQGLTIALKEASRRSRPQGVGFSFPSGHTTLSFASATVLQQHFGWKAGIPAYAVATYVAASRVQMKRHYLSDVTFGAALGIVAGRTVSIGDGRRLLVTPIATSLGTAAGFTWLGKP